MPENRPTAYQASHDKSTRSRGLPARVQPPKRFLFEFERGLEARAYVPHWGLTVSPGADSGIAKKSGIHTETEELVGQLNPFGHRDLTVQ